MTYISQLSPTELSALSSQLSPPVRAQLEVYLAGLGRSAPGSPGIPRPRTAVPVPTPLRPDPPTSPGPPSRHLHGLDHVRLPTGRHRASNLPEDPDAPLLSVPAVQAVLAAFSPAARRYMRSLDATGRHAAAAQRELQQVGRFAIRCEQARQSTEADRSRLYRLAQHQQQELVTNAARLASMQAHCDEQRRKLREEQERSRTLERGLRAMAREASWARDASTTTKPYGAIGTAWDAIGLVVEEVLAD